MSKLSNPRAPTKKTKTKQQLSYTAEQKNEKNKAGAVPPTAANNVQQYMIALQRQSAGFRHYYLLVIIISWVNNTQQHSWCVMVTQLTKHSHCKYSYSGSFPTWSCTRLTRPQIDGLSLCTWVLMLVTERSLAWKTITEFYVLSGVYKQALLSDP